MNKKFILFIGILFVILSSVYFHTTGLTVSHHTVTLSQGGKTLKFAHVTDLHTKGMGRLEKKLVEVLEIEKPDIIVITGDIATPAGTVAGYKDVLKNLKASRGVFFVPGNWEYWETIPNLKELLHEAQIIDLTNKVKEIDKGLWLIGFDDGEEGRPDLEIIKSIPVRDLKISLFHSPSFFDQIVSLIPLSFAGHSHGGQVRIPFLGSIWVPEGTGKYDQGWFEKGSSKMFVSRGIGTSILPIRFNCSPEVAIINVEY